MACWDLGMHHIVDVDGQLLAIDAEVIAPAALLARANRPGDRDIWLVRAGERMAVHPHRPLRLSKDEVLFIETVARPLPYTQRLAA